MAQAQNIWRELISVSAPYDLITHLHFDLHVLTKQWVDMYDVAQG